MTDRSVASARILGFSASAFIGTGLSVAGSSAAALSVAHVPATGLPVVGLPVAVLSGLGFAVRVERGNERPTKALDAAAGKATAYGFAATGAGTQQQTMTHDHKMWAFRGLEPWSDPV
ncbi:hypothetical protein AB0G79_22825 [Streptomyces sp. NPDC020807]|uniref:hypothetical protein n=1 Tax=Streptomyces sp. NPDC020807 TaxID=3155119 RepID=UPI0033CD9414